MQPPDLEAIAQRHGVAVLVQHGSTVMGPTHAQSDLDLAALFERSPSLSQQAALATDLADAFPNQVVDLAILNHADPLFLDRVVQKARLLAGSTRRFAELQTYAFKYYQDHRRFLELEGLFVDRFVAERRDRP